MPFCKCPKCDAMHHLNISVPLKAWYAEHCPGLSLDIPAPIICFKCFMSMTKEEKSSYLKELEK